MSLACSVRFFRFSPKRKSNFGPFWDLLHCWQKWPTLRWFSQGWIPIFRWKVNLAEEFFSKKNSQKWKFGSGNAAINECVLKEFLQRVFRSDFKGKFGAKEEKLSSTFLSLNSDSFFFFLLWIGKFPWHFFPLFFDSLLRKLFFFGYKYWDEKGGREKTQSDSWMRPWTSAFPSSRFISLYH